MAELIAELQSFDDKSLEVRISLDGGASSVAISVIGRLEGRYAVLMNCQEVSTVIQHRD